MSGKQIGIWTEMIVAYFKLKSLHHVEGL